MIKLLHKMGIKSNHMYMAGFASIGMSLLSWYTSYKHEAAGTDRADRWAIFVGQWAPTFFGIGVGLHLEETHRELEEGSGEEMYGQSSGRMSERVHAGSGM